jgi:hypothetical protein
MRTGKVRSAVVIVRSTYETEGRVGAKKALGLWMARARSASRDLLSRRQWWAIIYLLLSQVRNRAMVWRFSEHAPDSFRIS